MKKYLLLVLALVVYAGVLQSQWVSNYTPNIQNDLNFTTAKGNAITVDHEGYSYVTGYCSGLLNDNDVITIKYNSDGDTLWARSYDGTANSNDEGTGICVDSYGNVYVVGSCQMTGRHYDLTVIKYDAEGNFQWAQPYFSFAGYREDRGTAITVDNSGYIYVTGFTSDEESKQDMVTIKYSPDGYNMWLRVEDGEGDNNSHAQGLALEVASNGDVYIAGFFTTDSTNTDIAVVKYDNDDGSLIWMRSIEGGSNEEDKAWGIAVDESNVFITGYVTASVNNNNTDCYTARMDSEGNIAWSRTYNGGGNSMDKAWGIAVDESNVFITGQTTAAYGNVNYATIKYSSNGTELWGSSYNGTGNGSDVSSAIGIVINPDNTKSVVVTGKSWGMMTYDYATVKYNITTGSQTSVKRYSMSGLTNDIAKDLKVSDDNKVYITGYSQLIFGDSPDGQSYISTMVIDWGTESEMITGSNTPQKFALQQNYPNPFNPSTTIKFDISNKSDVKLAIYDMLGKEVDVLVNQQLEAGTYTISYTNKNLASGVYFYQIRAGEFKDIKKMTLIK